ncbi:hypothetical protein T10_743 [Trichinella papuae]|uniref:Uncharacterized protein n=1 Tax=Trichinella papuae TaxID=268474 RepID=A0A0V1M7Y0_9BILA|nr:hypothetical protein T10_743 [Trichinella papuae]
MFSSVPNLWASLMMVVRVAGSDGYWPVVFSVGARIVGFGNEGRPTILEVLGDVPCEKKAVEGLRKAHRVTLSNV